MFEHYKDSKVGTGNAEPVYRKVHLIYLAVGLFVGFSLTPLLGDNFGGVFALVCVAAAMIFYFAPNRSDGAEVSLGVVEARDGTEVEDDAETEVEDETYGDTKSLGGVNISRLARCIASTVDVNDWLDADDSYRVNGLYVPFEQGGPADEDLHKIVRVMIEVISSDGRIEADKLATLIAADENIYYVFVGGFYGPNELDAIQQSFYEKHSEVFGEFEEIHGRPLASWERYTIIAYIWKQFQKVADESTGNYRLPLRTGNI